LRRRKLGSWILQILINARMFSGVNIRQVNVNDYKIYKRLILNEIVETSATSIYSPVIKLP
jgi:hypothetical protein